LNSSHPEMMVVSPITSTSISLHRKCPLCRRSSFIPLRHSFIHAVSSSVNSACFPLLRQVPLYHRFLNDVVRFVKILVYRPSFLPAERLQK
jgi:hypothetical protein